MTHRPRNPGPSRAGCPVDRRAFLKGVAAATVTIAGATIPAEAQAPQSAQRELRWKKAPCRFCGVGCGLLVGIQGGKAVAVKGDPDSPVSKGLACLRGYYSIQTLYGPDRLTRARVRLEGSLVDVPIRDALDLVARRLRETIERHGKDSVALYGSAQWTITDAYVASKFFKGALGTNNVETSARLHAASGMAGLQSTFGADGAVGCYEDIDHADVFVLWNANLAETDPVLFSRMLARRRTNPAVRIIDLAARTTRTSYGADHSLLYAPQSELAIANAICQEIVARRSMHRDFVDRHVAFKRGKTGIGYGLAGDTPVEDVAVDASWDEYVAFLAAYTAERAQQLSGMPAESIRWLASLYGDRSRKVLSVWGPGVNQQARGTWMNNALYNIHLLTGKIAQPGDNALCLTGQPGGGSAVHGAGTLSDTLPRGLVQNDDDRRRAAELWGVPADRIAGRPARRTLGMFQALEKGDIRFLWIQATNPMVSLPNLGRYRRATAKADRFLVVSEAYPTPTSDLADVVLPAAMWIEREGIYGNAERRLQHWERMVTPPGDAMSDAAQMIEVARRLGHGTLFPEDRGRDMEGIWNEYRRFRSDQRDAIPALAQLREQPGLIWPFINGRETRWRYNSAHDPAADARQGRGGYDFYGHADHRAWIWLRPHDPAPEVPDREYPFWLGTGGILEHWGTGSMTRRVPTLHRAAPRAYAELNRDDAQRLGIRNGDRVRLVSRRGALEIEARIDHRSQPSRGQVFVPRFDESLPVNQLMLDACCPLSGQPGSQWCAVRVERVTPRTGA